MATEVSVARSKASDHGLIIAVSLVAVVAILGYWQEHQQVTQLRQQVAQQASNLQRQSTVIQAEAKPDLPLSVGFRHAILGTGLVMELRNNSGSQIEVGAAFTSEATGLTQQRNIVLPANLVVQLGSSQGWAFVPGQHIAFKNANFRPAEYVVPQG